MKNTSKTNETEMKVTRHAAGSYTVTINSQDFTLYNAAYGWHTIGETADVVHNSKKEALEWLKENA